MANRLHMDLSINGIAISFTTTNVVLARRVFAAALSVAGEGKKVDPNSKIQISSNGENRIQVIKAIREVTGLGLKEAKDRTEVPLPYAILPEEFTRAGFDRARAVLRLQEAGAVVVGAPLR